MAFPGGSDDSHDIMNLRGTIEGGRQAGWPTGSPGGDGQGWLEHRPRLATGLAWMGVAVGFLLLVVPGVFALRCLRRWRDLGVTPDLAWSLGPLGIWLGVGRRSVGRRARLPRGDRPDPRMAVLDVRDPSLSRLKGLPLVDARGYHR